MTYINQLSTRLRTLRKAWCLTLKEVSTDLEFSEQCLSQYERGVREPNIDTLLKIAEYYETTIDFLALGKGAAPIIPTINEHKSSSRKFKTAKERFIKKGATV